MFKTIIAAGGIMAGLSFSSTAGELTVNVKDAGAAGNGTTDDSRAIRKAVASINKNKSGKLFFPKGAYLFKSNGTAMLFKGVSNVSVKFDKDAVLLIDNLKAGGRGNGHGILFKDPGKNITLENITLQWKVKPKYRSNGDGIRFDGYPSPEKTISNIIMSNCRVINAPQTGAIFHGCSDVTVKNFRPEHTKADGLHFNACRKVKIDGVTGLDTGDDTLALVTYYHPTKIGAYRESNPPFNQLSLGEWNNTGSTAMNISSSGGRANGIRVAGGKDITISNVSVKSKGFSGIQIDAAKKTTTNRAVGWSYLASKNIRINNVKVLDCPVGFIVRTLNILPDEPDHLWRHSVAVTNLDIKNCRNGIQLLDSGDIEIAEVSSDSAICLMNARGKYSLKNINLNDTSMYINGTQGQVFQGWKRNREPKPFLAIKDLSNLVDKEIVVSNLKITGGMLRISDCAGVKVDDLSVLNPPQLAIGIYKTKNCVLENIQVTSKNTPLQVSNINDITIENCIYGPAAKFMLAGAKEQKSITLKKITRR